MFKVYNNKYKTEIHSYTKDFQDFFDRRYYDLLEAKIKAEDNRLKKLNADPSNVKRGRKNYYTKAYYNFRFPKLRQSLDSQGFGNISDFDLSDDLKAYPKWENADIVAGLIEKYKGRELIDSDVIEENIDKARELRDWTDAQIHWSKQEDAYNEKYKIQYDLEREMEKKDPIAYAKFKKEELERWRESMTHMSKHQLAGVV